MMRSVGSHQTTVPSREPTTEDTARRTRTSQEGDFALVRRVMAQDQQAFDLLYARYASRLAGFLKRWLYEPERVDEVLNDVMMVLWQHPARIPPTVPLIAWLCGVARHKARKALARASTPPCSQTPQEQIDHDEPESVFLRQEYVHVLTRTLDILPLCERTALELLVYQGYSYQEIAAATGDPVSTIRTRVSRARQRLRIRIAAPERRAS